MNSGFGFGRYSERNKSRNKILAWQNSEKLYNEKKYIDCYEAFLNYIRDDNTENLDFRKVGDEIVFEFFQGSKIINGSISEKGISAESDIAEFEMPAVAVMRRLLELNYNLLYCRYALKNNRIYLKFNSSLKDGAPRKLYYAFRELANNADRHDDLLTNEFKSLKTINSKSIIPVTEHEKQVKYKYFKKWIEEAIKITDNLNQDAYSGAISYVLLNTMYKIDYLTVPQGIIMHELERLNWQYFANDNKPYTEKNRIIKNALSEFLNKPEDEILGNFYRTKSTFGIPLPSAHSRLADVIHRNIENVRYYVENNQMDIALHICEYIASHCLFIFGLPQPDAKLLDLLMKILNQDYLTELGADETYYDSSKNALNIKLIKNEIKLIVKNSKPDYPEFNFNTDLLNFESLISFSQSFYNQIKSINFQS